MLRLSLTHAPVLETIPASPIFAAHEQHEHTSFTLHPPQPLASAPAPPSPPTFTIAVPSAAAVRRQKMDRLRRRLGEDVPPEMVFPLDDEEDDEEVVSPILSFPAVPVRRSAKARTGIPGARDSIVVSRARASRGGEEEWEWEFEPSYPPSAASSSGSKCEKLCVIMESPDEGGVRKRRSVGVYACA